LPRSLVERGAARLSPPTPRLMSIVSSNDYRNAN
jgi:hypothetical protein